MATKSKRRKRRIQSVEIDITCQCGACSWALDSVAVRSEGDDRGAQGAESDLVAGSDRRLGADALAVDAGSVRAVEIDEAEGVVDEFEAGMVAGDIAGLQDDVVVEGAADGRHRFADHEFLT